ncbi:Acyl-CoA synthetase (AMP-forming)/AMP-acid ligase II [Malonomonas rubra DSM 5091]|uniref:Acyl-CoA synthetase (AMP-forming)/AMP-acid ligase II n=1 Tax=Malonomonas rubra DSM 5091 TaxID=1122189 RepID=A0A1M6LI32_MALRU|nr:fatty acid CoA ligase family protein [Malonomonas rubra]SHJ70862.1 Acyl-CoA synthetase (AMP-forming)/AMP-acid ligase II [Malonomonas rubra DSM 5091]
MSSGMLTNIAAHLPAMARRQPDTPAIHIPTGKGQKYKTFSFKQLDRESDRIAHGLEEIGIGRGVHTALMVTPGLEFFALTFALFKVGAVPIMIDPGIGIKNLKICLAEAEPEAFVGIPKAHVARLLFGWGKPTLKTLLTVGGKLFWGGSTLRGIKRKAPADKPYRVVETESGETAAILFTSGSTGVPKGVVYTHGNFIAQVEQLKAVYDIQPGEIDLPTFPLFALFAPALGMSSVVPVMDFTRPGSVDPKNIIDPIKKFNITTMFGSPALINRVGRYGEENGIKLPSLKRAISAGAPVPASVLERFTKMLGEGVEVFTPYGATESLPVCSIGSREILQDTRKATDNGFGVCVGMPVPGIKLEIISTTDEPIDWWNDDLKVPANEIGEIVVSGAQVTRRYFNRKKSTDLAKILDPPNATFYHRMGDLGYRDNYGRIWFCGRKAHRVTCTDKTLYTIPCEAIFNTHPKVFRSALVGVGKPGNMKPVICIELEPGIDKNEHAQIIRELKLLTQKHELIQPIGHILIHPAFPVDIRHNAKIFREKLAVWAKGQIR